MKRERGIPINGEHPKRQPIFVWLDKYALRSYKQVWVHSAVAILFAALLTWLLGDRTSINNTSFVVVTSSIAAASGALLAISVGLVTFFSRHLIDWRDRTIEKLARARAELILQMEKSASQHPEITRRLTELYLKAVSYIPGQSVDYEEIRQASGIFNDWATEMAHKSTRRFDFANLSTYGSFEKHLFDAHFRCKDVSESLTLLGVIEIGGRGIRTFAPLIIGWIVILALALILAIIGGAGVIPGLLSLGIIAMLFYLFAVAVLALTMDTLAIIGHMRTLETGYEQAILQLSAKSSSQSFYSKRPI
jgi:hypothetical protein